MDKTEADAPAGKFLHIETKWLVLLAVGVGTFMSASAGNNDVSRPYHRAISRRLADRPSWLAFCFLHQCADSSVCHLVEFI